MTGKNICIIIITICLSFVCGIVALIAGKMIALCVGLLLAGAAILAAAFVIYFVTKEHEQKRLAEEEQKPIRSSRSRKNAKR